MGRENFELKAELVRRYGTQSRAARELGLSETRLSRIIRGYREPAGREREIIESLGVRLEASAGEK